MNAGLYPEEQRLLDVLNIQPTDVTRKSDAMFDVSFAYEKRWLTDPRFGGKTIPVVAHADGKVTHSSFVMPPVGSLESCRARAHMMLLIISLAHDHHTDEVCRMMWGRTLPDYAGDWSFIRDARDDEQWGLFEKAGNKFFATPELAARFAQP